MYRVLIHCQQLSWRALLIGWARRIHAYNLRKGGRRVAEATFSRVEQIPACA
jgi:hypothetical protein